MKYEPSISVVIPMYNSAGTIRQTIASVMTQTFRDFEIIAIDDGSHDLSAEIVESIAKWDVRIRLICKTNNGASAARNSGIRAARGCLVALLDADDIWAPDHLETHYNHFRANPSLGVSFSPVQFINADGTATNERSRPKLFGFKPSDLLSTNPCTTCSTMVVRHIAFHDIGMFQEQLMRAEDQEWLFRVSLSHWQIRGIDRPLVYYRNSPAGLSSDLEGMFAGFAAMLNFARHSAPEIVDQCGSLAAARMLRYLARRALRLNHGQWTAVKYLFRATLCSPAIFIHEPRQSFGTLIAALVPGLATFVLAIHRA